MCIDGNLINTSSVGCNARALGLNVSVEVPLYHCDIHVGVGDIVEVPGIYIRT